MSQKLSNFSTSAIICSTLGIITRLEIVAFVNGFINYPSIMESRNPVTIPKQDPEFNVKRVYDHIFQPLIPNCLSYIKNMALINQKLRKKF